MSVKAPCPPFCVMCRMDGEIRAHQHNTRTEAPEPWLIALVTGIVVAVGVAGRVGGVW